MGRGMVVFGWKQPLFAKKKRGSFTGFASQNKGKPQKKNVKKVKPNLLAKGKKYDQNSKTGRIFFLKPCFVLMDSPLEVKKGNGTEENGEKKSGMKGVIPHPDLHKIGHNGDKGHKHGEPQGIELGHPFLIKNKGHNHHNSGGKEKIRKIGAMNRGKVALKKGPRQRKQNKANKAKSQDLFGANIASGELLAKVAIIGGTKAIKETQSHASGACRGG